MRTHLLPIAIALSFAFPVAAAAQDVPRAELFGGYSYLRDEGESFHGWNGSLTYNLSGALGLVADLSGHYGSAPEGGDLESFAYLGGLRLSRRGASATPFVHALVGGVRASDGVSVFGVSISASETNLGGALGGGVDFGVASRWALRVQADYFVVRAEGEGGDKEFFWNPRVSVGAVLRLGRR